MATTTRRAARTRTRPAAAPKAPAARKPPAAARGRPPARAARPAGQGPRDHGTVPSPPRVPRGDPAAILAAVPEPRRSELTRLDRLIRETVPALAPCVTAGMMGYGPFHYRYASGREGDTATLAIASRASGLALYACAADERGYVAERYRARLPRADIGKACVRFKRLDDLDLAALRDLLREAATAGYGEAHGTVVTPT